MQINWRNLLFVIVISMVLNIALASVGAPDIYQMLIAFAVGYGAPHLGIPIFENLQEEDTPKD